jgi:hypothetical protein
LRGRAAAIVDRWFAAHFPASPDAARLLVAASPDELRAVLVEVVAEIIADKGA